MVICGRPDIGTGTATAMSGLAVTGNEHVTAICMTGRNGAGDTRAGNCAAAAGGAATIADGMMTIEDDMTTDAIIIAAMAGVIVKRRVVLRDSRKRPGRLLDSHKTRT